MDRHSKHIVRRNGPLLAAAVAAGAVASSTPVVAESVLPGAESHGKIVYSVQNEDGFADIYVAAADGSTPQQVPLDGPLDALWGAFWDPTGTRLLIGRFLLPEPFQAATVRPDGSEYTPLDIGVDRFDKECLAWSPDGTRILCGMGPTADQSDPGLFSVGSTGGGDAIRLTTNPFGGRDIPGDYSPDGSRIVFTRQQPGPGKEEVGALIVVNADGTGEHQVTEWGIATSHDNAFAHWSPDGSQIVFAGREGTLMVVQPDGTGLAAVDLTQGDASTFAYSPGWSPDGELIIFSMWTSATDQVDLYTVRPDGTDLVQITDTPEIENFADWTDAET